MSKLDGLKNKLQEMWDKRALGKDTYGYLEKIVYAANENDAGKLQRFLKGEGITLLQAAKAHPSLVEYAMLLATPEGFGRLMALPGISVEDKQAYLSEAARKGHSAPAEFLLKDTAVATQELKDKLLVDQFLAVDPFGTNESRRVRMSQLLVKYGASLEAAETAAEKNLAKVKEGAQLQVARAEQKKNDFLKQLKPA